MGLIGRWGCLVVLLDTGGRGGFGSSSTSWPGVTVVDDVVGLRLGLLPLGMSIPG